jgi:anti-sigma B factor antagonist
MRMQIEVRPHDARTFLVLGELDMSTAEELLRELEPALERTDADLTLDLSGLEFIDSSGLRALLEVSRRLDGGGKLLLASPSDPAARVFQLVRIDTFPNIQVSDTG